MVDGSTPRRWLRRLFVALTALGVLAAVVLGGAGWYYAGEIHEGALRVAPGARGVVPDTVVESVAGGQVVLRRTGEPGGDDPLLGDGTYGLVWDGGAAVVSGPPEPRDDGAVARRIQLVDGPPPEPGTATDLRGDVRTEPLRALGPAVEAGLPALFITYRNDPEAPADPSGRYGQGATEWRDLEAAVRFALDQGAADVVLYGASMGGAVVAAFLERSDLADAVSGVVLDAPVLDLAATVEHGAAQRDLPLVGGVPGVLTGTARWIAGWRYDLDWDAVDHLPADWLEVPALVFHGTDDELVPVSTTDELAADRPELVTAVRVADGGHVRVWNADPAGYERRVAAFLDCLAGGAGQRC